MKNYLREQVKSMVHGDSKQNYKSYTTISSLNFIELCMKYLKALIPYMHLPNLYDNFYECLQLIFQFIGEGNEDNISILLDENFIGIANQILNLRQFLDSEPENNKRCRHKKSYSAHSDAFNIIKKNFEIILKVSNENSWLENADYILEKAHLYEQDDEDINYINQKDAKKVCLNVRSQLDRSYLYDVILSNLTFSFLPFPSYFKLY